MKPSPLSTLALLAQLLANTNALPILDTDSPPSVALGYATYQASSPSSSTTYHNFSNIRYAAPPLSALRFSPPSPLSLTSSPFSAPSSSPSCPQALPAWLLIGSPNAEGAPFNTTPSNFSAADIPPPAPGESEDCLFLDVLVPKEVWDARQTAKKGAPVLVWIHGGGFVLGSKTSFGAGDGLVARGQEAGEGVVFVAINYRLGLFGFLSVLTFERNAPANLGLLDQRFALEWVRRNIHLFGGDPGRVTVMGESAGGGSVMAHLTAYGALKDGALFHRAIVQSPFLGLVPGKAEQEEQYNKTLQAAGVDSFAGLKGAAEAELRVANALTVGTALYGTFGYGPTVDGSLIPAPPALLLASGQFDRSVSVMTAHNSDEGILFASPFVTTETDYISYLSALLPSLNASALATTAQNRLAQTVGDLFIVCNAHYLNEAFGPRTYSYLFAVPPGFHGEDLGYTFFDGASSVNSSLAVTMQKYFTNFASSGDPNAKGLPVFPVYADSRQVLTLNVSGVTPRLDQSSKTRCQFWRAALAMQ
ncbi:hypothetical protein MMC13_002749 [Lambiella insularis]|nr:hypothetical protein [Lambiella insularis]